MKFYLRWAATAAVAALALTLFGGSANAATFTYNFTGTLNNIPSITTPPFTFAIGDPISASVSINTLSPLIPGSNQYRFLGSNSITLGGNTYASGSDNLHITVDSFGGGWQAGNSNTSGNQPLPAVTPTVNGSPIGFDDQLQIFVTTAAVGGPLTLPDFLPTDTFTNVLFSLSYGQFVPEVGFQSFSVQGTGNLLAVSEVPLPGAVWLFGSGLLGLLGVARTRRKKA